MIENSIKTARLLVVSRDFAVLRLVWSIGKSSCWQLENAANAWEAMERMQTGATPDLLLLDLPQGDADGLHILRWLRRVRPALPIILIGHANDSSKKQEAVRLGAKDYLLRPLDDRQLEISIRRNLSIVCEAAKMSISSDDVELISDGTFFIGISPIMRRLRVQAALLAEANDPVLILGEGGSGKETTARLVHKLSVRSGFEFATVNCAALPSDLLAKELFGYESNGTAGHERTKSGKLELCAKGTILLDEITEMPIGMQAKLLQVLDNKWFIRPGTSTYVDVDVRVLVTSTTNLEHAISENRLREDLYYRLSAHTIHVPPLRERKEELHLLSRYFMHQLAQHYGLSPRDFSPAILEAGQAYSWPGNLRELESFVKHYLMVGDKALAFEKSRPYRQDRAHNAASTTPEHAYPRRPSLTQPRAAIATDTNSLRAVVQGVKVEAEKSAIAAALDKTRWNRKAAARLLNVSYRTLLYKIERYQMRSPASPPFPANNGAGNKGTGLGGNGQPD